MSERTPATEQMARLVEQRERANARIDEVQQQARDATSELGRTREALITAEREGAGAAARRKLEQELTTAKARSAEPWAERVEGARRAARDAQQVVQRFVGEHLDELVEARQVEGQAAAERINTACAEMLAGYAEWARVSQGMSQLLSLVGPVRPGDVSFSRCEALAREARRLLDQGGEQAPVLRHARGQVVEPAQVA
jgi:chromosome segregation ATPase